jgi:hypothetical protein
MFVPDRVELRDENVVILFPRHSDVFERSRHRRPVLAPEHLIRPERPLSALYRHVQSHEHLFTVLPCGVHLSLTVIGE